MARTLHGVLAALSLLACLVAPVLYLRQAIGEAEFKNALLAASVAWFVFGGLWVRGTGRTGRQRDASGIEAGRPRC